MLTRGPRASVGEGVLVWALGDALEQVGAGRAGVGRRELGRSVGRCGAVLAAWVGPSGKKKRGELGPREGRGRSGFGCWVGLGFWVPFLFYFFFLSSQLKII